MHNKTIGILGCGWLGLPMARYFLLNGYAVKATTTTPAKVDILRKEGIDPYLLEFNPNVKGTGFEGFFDSDILVINIPPSLRKKGEGFHIAQIRELCKLIGGSSIKRVIYVSSTSVYPEVDREVNEEEQPIFDHEIFEAEEQLKSLPNIRLIILRCGGLMGYDRIPAKYFAGKQGISGGYNPVNYIHRDDVVQIVYALLKKNNIDHGEIFNLVAPLHPTRKEVCEKTALAFGYPVPQFTIESPKNYKIVKSSKIIKVLNYQFKYLDPVEFQYG